MPLLLGILLGIVLELSVCGIYVYVYGCLFICVHVLSIILEHGLFLLKVIGGQFKKSTLYKCIKQPTFLSLLALSPFL